MGAKSTTLLELFLAEQGKIIRLIGRIVGCRQTASGKGGTHGRGPPIGGTARTVRSDV